MPPAASSLKILLLKPSSLGDVVQALPVLRLLKRHDPAHEVYWWLSSDLVPLLEDDPDLAGIIPFHRRRWGSPWNWLELAQSIRQMRAMRFDWVIDLQSLLRSALVAWLSRGAMTIGLEDPREGAPAFYDYAIPRPSPQTRRVTGANPPPARRRPAASSAPHRRLDAANAARRYNPGRCRSPSSS